MSLQPQAEHEAIQEARQRQELPEFKEKYHARAGIEGTLSQAVVALGMRETILYALQAFLPFRNGYAPPT